MVHASLEKEFAKRMSLDRVGTPFALDVAGIRLDAVVSSLRKVQWFQFRPNFTIILNGQDIIGAPLSYTALSQVPTEMITAFQEEISENLKHASPIDLTRTASQIQGLLDKLLLTIQFSSIFLFIAALMVLAAVSWAKRSEKSSEFALLKCLGVNNSTLGFQLISEIVFSVFFAWILTWILVLPVAQLISAKFLSADLTLPSLQLSLSYILGLSSICIIIYLAINIGLVKKKYN